MGYVRPKRAKRPANRPKWPSHSLRRRVWTTRFFEIHDPGAFDEHFFNGLLDVLHVVSEVIKVTPSRSKPDRGMVSVRSETRNQHGDVLQVATVRIVVPPRPGASKAAPA